MGVDEGTDSGLSVTNEIQRHKKSQKKIHHQKYSVSVGENPFKK